jgi:hypothetical protein
MYKITANAYFLKGKIVEIETSTGKGREEDLRVESHEKTIAELLAKIVATKKPEKKVVYFIEWEGTFYETKGGKLDKETFFDMKKVVYTPAEFKKITKQLHAADMKEYNKVYEEAENVG